MSAAKRNRCIFHPRKDGEYSGFIFSEEWCQTAFLQFGYHLRRKYMGYPEGCNPSALGFQSVREASLLAHDFPLESLVCYDTFGDR